MKKKIVLIGGGGHCKVVIDALKLGKKFDICGITDTKLPAQTTILGIPVLGKDEILLKVFKKGIKYAFYQRRFRRRCSVRKRIDDKLRKSALNFP
jgi:UDP-perosamine 4-acetyltransferase